jgi:hypothetical protein
MSGAKTVSAAVVNRTGPPQHPGDLRAREFETVELAPLDHMRDERLAVTLG